MQTLSPTPSAPVQSAWSLNLVWLALMLLTLLSYGFSASSDSTSIVLMSGTLKAILIGAVFMELWRGAKSLLAVYIVFFGGLGLSLMLLLSI